MATSSGSEQIVNVVTTKLFEPAGGSTTNVTYTVPAGRYARVTYHYTIVTSGATALFTINDVQVDSAGTTTTINTTPVELYMNEGESIVLGITNPAGGYSIGYVVVALEYTKP